MLMVKKILAVALMIVAAAVAIHFIFSPFYPDEDFFDINRMWGVLDVGMAVSVLVMLVFNYSRKRAYDASAPEGGSVTRQYLELNVLLYATIVLGIMFFWNWFDYLDGGQQVQNEMRLTFWGFIDPLLSVTIGVTGCNLWRSADAE